MNENELHTVVLDCANSTNLSATKFNDKENKTINSKFSSEQMPLNLEANNTNISFTDDEKPVSNSYHKLIQVEATSNDLKSLNGYYNHTSHS